MVFRQHHMHPRYTLSQCYSTDPKRMQEGLVPLSLPKAAVACNGREIASIASK